MPVKADTLPLQVLQMRTPELSTLGKAASGEQNGMLFVNMQLISLLEYVGVQWTKGQVAECAKTTYNEYHYFTLAELKQFFTKVKAGHYTSNKNMMPPVFMEFLKSYADEMLAERYAYFSAEAQKPKWTPPANPVSDEVFAEGMAKLKGLFAPDPELSIAENLGGEEKFNEAREHAAAKARELGVDQESINNLKNSAK